MSGGKYGDIFEGSGLDYVHERRTDAPFLIETALNANAKFLPFYNTHPLFMVEKLGEEGPEKLTPAWKSREDFPQDVFNSFLPEVILLGIDWSSGTAYHAVSLNSDKTSAGDALFDTATHKYIELRRAFGAMWSSPRDFVTIAHARHLVEWSSKCKFCGRCGATTVPYYGGWKRRCSNTETTTNLPSPSPRGPALKCGIPHYPRIDPVIISAVVSTKGKFLLIRGPKFPPGMHTIVSGFMNPGETIEEAVRREVREETGVEVGRVEYFASQPWPFAGEIMIGCIAHAVDDYVEVDEHEISFADWFTKEQVAEALQAGIKHSAEFWHVTEFRVPPPFAIAHHIIKHWVESQPTTTTHKQ